MQGIQDQKKRDILQIYITYNIILLILRSTKRNSAQKETKERKKVTERGREIEVDDIHKINRTTSTVCRLYISISIKELIFYKPDKTAREPRSPTPGEEGGLLHTAPANVSVW